MITNTSRRALLRAFTPLAISALAFGCGGSRPAPAVGAAAANRADGPIRPSVVGQVLLSSTHEPSPLGGVVYLEDAPKQPGELMSQKIVLHQKEFVPRISVLTVGGTATFDNADPMPHHVFSSDVSGWDTGELKHGQPATKSFDTPGPKALLCNIHPEMLGYLLVIPSTYYGLIGTDGRYVIGNVPAGTYKVTVWVPRAPNVTKSVTVSDAAAASADFQVQPAEATH